MVDLLGGKSSVSPSALKASGQRLCSVQLRTGEVREEGAVLLTHSLRDWGRKKREEGKEKSCPFRPYMTVG